MVGETASGDAADDDDDLGVRGEVVLHGTRRLPVDRDRTYRSWAMSARKSPGPTSTLCVRPITVPEVPAR